MRRALVKALANPDDFENGDEADKARLLFSQTLHDSRRLWGLHGVVLSPITQKKICMQSNHFPRLNLSVAPASIPASMSASDTGLAGFGTTPLSREVGIFGRMITPSG